MQKSLVYEVNVDLEMALAADYEAWLKPHIEEVLATGAFLNASCFKRESNDTTQMGYTLHYFAKSEVLLEQYLTYHAPRLRKEAEMKFGGRFTAFRRILRSL